MSEAKTNCISSPKTFIELTMDGGIWIGEVFIVLYISLGTIIGIPTGTLFPLLIRRAEFRQKTQQEDLRL